MTDTPAPAAALTDREKLLVGMLMAAEKFLLARGAGKSNEALSCAKVFGSNLDEYLEGRSKK